MLAPGFRDESPGTVTPGPQGAGPFPEHICVQVGGALDDLLLVLGGDGARGNPDNADALGLLGVNGTQQIIEPTR